MALVKAVNLKKYFPVRRGLVSFLLRKPSLHIRAVDGVDFKIKKGEIFGLAGESGCGKTTVGRLTLRSIEPTEGEVYYQGKNILSLSGDDLRKLRREIQMIFQDPYESLDPRMTVYDIVSEPLSVHRLVEDEEEKIDAVSKALEEVGLVPPEEFLYRYPHELSGGQRQRVAVARALILKPKFIVADEPVSMLDVSIRTGILNLMLDLKRKYDLTYLFITHDLAVCRYICDRLAIMYLGKIVEVGKVDEVIEKPLHPYCKALVVAVPVPDPSVKIGEVPVKGEVPSPVNVPPGCRFHPRCPYTMDVCKREEPPLEGRGGHLVACHLH
jgi:peptide/nickel transport system ATP-binding protein